MPRWGPIARRELIRGLRALGFEGCTRLVQRIEKKIVLIDGPLLALMIEHGLGVTTVAAYEVKKVDSDFFAED